MKSLRSFQWAAALLVCCSWFVPVQHLAAAPPSSPGAATLVPQQRPIMQDVALGAGGVLRGQFVDKQGRPLAEQTIYLAQDGQPLTKTVTTDQGRFTWEGVAGGTYQIVGPGALATCRCWTEGTAPPAATSEMLIAQGEIHRGQKPAVNLLHPILIGLVIAAAIAIPIALKRDKPPAS